MKQNLFSFEGAIARRIARASAICVAWMFLLALSITPAWAAPERQVLQNHVPAAALNTTPISRSSRWTMMDLAIGLPLRNKAELTNLLSQLYDPSSTNYHHYLTPEEFTQRFGPTEADYQSVIKFASEQGFAVTGTHSNRMIVDVKGAVANIERAFHVTMNVYQHPTEKRTFIAPNVEPSLDLATPVLMISGLNDFVVPHPCLSPVPEGGPKAQVTGSGPGGYFDGFDFRHAYAPGTTLTGAGQAVGLLEFDGFYPADIVSYKSQAGLPDVPVNAVLLDGFTGTAGSGNIEVSLDIDMAIAMAPGLSQVIVYEGTVGNDILNRMATDRLANQLSASWTYHVDATTEQIFQQFGAQGQSFFNASGDSGAYGSTVSTPTDDPYITVVGGTDLTTTSAGGPWASESAWPSSSGGISPTFAIPAYQQGISMVANQGSTSFRNLPDVAMIADNCYLIYNNGTPTAVSGTSIAAPLWAGFIALVNQLAVSNGEPLVGFINPAVYAIGKGTNGVSYTSLFHDITTGNNESTANPTKFFSVAGYDLCTGWGTPNGNLISALALPEALRITPLAAAIVSGLVGGPFNPAVQTFLLSNNAPGSLTWSVSNSAPWLNVSPSSGTLVFGGPATTVTASLTSASSNLVAGGYTSPLSFTDLNDHFAQPRPLTLAIVTPPVITSQPTNEGVLIGGTASFTVGTATNALLYYHWRYSGTNLSDGGPLSGSLTSTLTITNVNNGYSGSYSVTISNAAGMVVSSNALLTVVPSAPVISLQPSNQTALPGASVTFSAAAIGNTPYFYQWQYNGTNLSKGNFTGVNTTTLTITNVSPANAGIYSLVVTNTLGSVTSTGAVLAVTSVTVPGVTMASIWSFTGGNSGRYLYSPLAATANGNLYGTTLQGGALNYGTVFRFNTNGSILTLFAFNLTTGANPYAGLCLGRDGNYYGAAQGGGTYNDGTLFRTTSGGFMTTMASLDGVNGIGPSAGLVQGTDGNFYGTTLQGGAYGFGTVFRMNSSGTVTTLVSFNNNDGAYPSPTLIQATDGNFYGTTENGGTNFGYGTIFKMTPAGNLTVLYSFDNGNNGGVPIPGVVQATDGNFYGTAIQGGSFGQGTVFMMTPSGALTMLYSFTNGIDGASPWGALMQASDGNLYGTTQLGGTYGFGTVFRFGPNGPVVPVAQFDKFNGSNPSAALVQGAGNFLYGTALQGGANGFGTIFKLGVNNGPLQITGQPADQVAYIGGGAMFTVAVAGATPVSYQWQEDGTNLTDGANISGSATSILRITNVNISDAAYFSVVVSNAFGSATSGEAALEIIFSPPKIISQPASLTQVTGSTAIFSVTATGDQPLTYQWRLNGTNLTDGGNISGSATPTLTLSGITPANGGTYSVGVSNSLFTVTSSPAALTVVPVAVPGAVATSLRQLNGSTDGAFPFAGLLQAADGNLYGTTTQGGTRFLGTIFKMTLGGGVSPYYSFLSSSQGANPYGGLFQSTNGQFYGTTFAGGANSDGAIFRMNPAGAVTFLYSFAGGLDGLNPYDGLLQGADGNFYGTANGGGIYSYGTIFKMDTTGTVTGIHEFTGGSDGAYPLAGLLQAPHGLFYGIAQSGGDSAVGTVFTMDTNGFVSPLASFDGIDGAYPQSGLTLGTDGNLYGTTLQGGTNGYGNVFSVTPAGVISNLFSFNVTNGANPVGGLVQGSDGNFYGTTSAGGLGGEGTVFRITPNGTLATLLWFDGFNGSNPQAALTQASDGSFYGTTFLGGVGFNPSSGGGYGTVFRLTVPIFFNSSFTATTAISSLPYSASISNSAVNPPGDSISFTKVSGPAWLGVAANGVISGTPSNANIGTNSFVVSVTDTNGLSATATMNVIVAPDPAPLFLSHPFAEGWANLGDPYSASISTNATAVYGSDVISFAKISGPAWLTVAVNGQLSGTPGSSDAGSNMFAVSATTLGGASTNATMYLYVNSPPTFAPASFTKTVATAGFPYSGTIATNATDPDFAAGDTLTFYKINGPAWLNVGTNGSISGTPSTNDIGPGNFLVLTVDSGGLAGLGTMGLAVTADHPPVFAGTPFTAPHANVGAPYFASIATNASDPDLGDVVTLSKISGPAWLNLAANGALTGTPAAADVGTGTFTVKATDLGGMFSQATMYVNVADRIRLSLAAQGSQLNLSWTGGTPPYQVQTATNLNNPAWMNLGGPVSSNSLSFTPGSAPAYFRIQGQ